MRYSPRGPEDLYDSLIPVVRGLGLDLVELTVSRHRGAVQVRAVVYKPGPLGVDDCSRAHRALLPRLELAFPGQDLYVEVSSPGIDRLIKDGAEFAFYRGRGVRCYRTDISDWSAGILESADEQGIVLRGKEGAAHIGYEIIAKAKLDASLE
jgi:ribosome maturation factor RimP